MLTLQSSKAPKDDLSKGEFKTLKENYNQIYQLKLYQLKKVDLLLSLTVMATWKNVWIKETMVHINYFCFYLGFLSRTFTIHRTAGEGGG